MSGFGTDTGAFPFDLVRLDGKADAPRPLVDRLSCDITAPEAGRGRAADRARSGAAGNVQHR